jgi:hypothetical protein
MRRSQTKLNPRPAVLWLLAAAFVAVSAVAHDERRILELEPPAPPEAATPPGAVWAAALYCAQHDHFLQRIRSAAPGPSPAGEALIAGLWGLFIHGPEGRLAVEVLSRGRRGEDGRTLEGDLVLRGLHPAVVDASELWEIVRAVRRQGIERISGRVLWRPSAELPQTAAAELELTELTERLRLHGVRVEARAASRTPEPLHMLYLFESVPVALLLRRGPELFAPLLPDAARLRRMLEAIDPQDIEWVPASHPELSPEDVTLLLRKMGRHGPLGVELTAALKPVALHSGTAVYGLSLRSAEVTELAGILSLEGHERVLLCLRVTGPVRGAQLAGLLDLLVSGAEGGSDWLLAQARMPAVRGTLHAAPQFQQ